MMNPIQHQLDQIHREDMLRQAEQSRLAAELAQPGTPFYAPALASLGKVLISAGTNLKNRYGELHQQPVTSYQVETA